MEYTHPAPWEKIPSEIINSINMTGLKKFYLNPVLKKNDTGACCNCGRVKSIQSGGLCSVCYRAAKNKRGVDLLNALTRTRARLTTEVDQIKSGTIGRGKVGSTDDEFERPKIIKTIPITDPKYSSSDSRKEYDRLIDSGSNCPECGDNNPVPCENVFLVDDSNPDEWNIVGSLDNPNISKNAVLRAEADEIMENNIKDNKAPEPHEVVTIKPVIKRSVVIEFGDAEIEFRSGEGLVDIRVEDGGDLVFFARGVEKQIIEAAISTL